MRRSMDQSRIRSLTGAATLSVWLAVPGLAFGGVQTETDLTSACSGLAAGVPSTTEHEDAVLACAKAVTAKREAQEQLVGDLDTQKVELKLTSTFKSEPGVDEESYGAGATWVFKTIDLVAMGLQFQQVGTSKGFNVIPDQLDLQLELNVKSDRKFLELERSKTDRIEFFPIVFKWSNESHGFKPYFKVGLSRSETVNRDNQTLVEVTEDNDEYSWKAGVEYGKDGSPWKLDVGQTWRFDNPASKKTSDELGIEVKYVFETSK